MSVVVVCGRMWWCVAGCVAGWAGCGVGGSMDACMGMEFVEDVAAGIMIRVG